MTKKHPADAIQELLKTKITSGNMTSLTDSADLVEGINDILHDPALVEALAGLEGEQAAALQEAMTHAVKMEALTKQMVEAEEAGDVAAMESLLAEFQNLSGAESIKPEVYPAPYDAIQDAIDDGDLSALKEALSEKPDLNKPLGKYESVPLAWAMTSFGEKRLEIARMLLEHGADAAFATSEGYTALHSLVDSPDREDTVALIDLLLAKGAPIEALQTYEWTPLLAAVMEGTPLVMEALLSRGANVHARFTQASMPVFSRGCTAMMVAAAEPDKIRLLLAYGADPAGSHDDGRGFNAYADDIATEVGYDPHSQDYRFRVEESRALINAARLN